jgi:hypothetical protein
MKHSTGPIAEFPISCFLTIWINSFLTREESLERVHDALALKINQIEMGALRLDVLDFLKYIKSEEICLARVHLPVSGNLAGIIDTGPYLDQALQLQQVISLIGKKNYAMVGSLGDYQISAIHLPPKSPINSWQEIDRLFAEFLPSISSSLEAFDLIASNQDAREWMISLEHNFSKLEFPEIQPARVTFLLGRLTRTLAIGQLAKANLDIPISSTKNSMFQNQLEELITKSRQYLAEVSNYHWINQRK